MEILVKTIKEALNKVKPGLSNKEMIEQSTSFVFQRGHVYTYNDEIAISHPLKIRVLGAVRARELLDFVNRIKDEKIEIIMNENKTELILLKKFSTATFALNQELILPINDIEIPDTSLPFKVREGEYEILVDHDVENNLLKQVRVNGVDMTTFLSLPSRKQRISRGFFGIRASMDAQGSGVNLQQFYWYYRVEFPRQSISLTG